MPSDNFGSIALYAARNGYAQLQPSGGVAVSGDSPFAQRLRDQLGGVTDGQVIEEPPRPPGVGNPDDPFHAFERRAKQLRLAAATVAMERGWKNLGGPKAIVGLPKENVIAVEERGVAGAGGYVALFRGGDLELAPDGTNVVNHKQTLISISLVGIECQIRQERIDEIYGVVSVLGPSNSTIVSRRFPESGVIEMGPGGLRIQQMDVPLVNRGVVQDYIVWTSMVENDSGDADAIAEKISAQFAQAAAAGIGALTGAPAESVADSETFKENLKNGVLWIVGDVFGAGDDAYNSQSFMLPWPTFAVDQFPVQPDVRRDDDPRTISGWTHKVILSGIDDGGDVGQYAYYFNVRIERIDIETRAETGAHT